jgi:hypothetical protein
MKTAIQLVAENLLDIKTLNIDQITEIVNILSMAMEKEKQQIYDAYSDGWQYGLISAHPQGKARTRNHEQYYQLTFSDSNQAGI